MNHPLPQTSSQSLEDKIFVSVLAAMFILIPFCYVPGAFVVVIVKESCVKAKFIQMISGAKESTYWVSTYLWDLTLYSLVVVLVLLVMTCFQSSDAFMGSGSTFLCTLALLIGYGLSIMPFSYLIARRFNNPSSAQLAVIITTFFTGFVSANVFYILNSIEKTQRIAQILRKVFRMWPAFNLGDGLIALTTSYWESSLVGEQSNPFDWDVAGLPVLLLVGLSLPYFGLVLLLEGSFLWIKDFVEGEWEKFILSWYDVRQTKDGKLILDDGLDDTKPLDSDVYREEYFLSKNFARLKQSYPVVFYNASKIYLPPNSGCAGMLLFPIFRAFFSFCRSCCYAIAGTKVPEETLREEYRALLPKRAVRGLSFAIRHGEAFVLLGSNGSGKSTSLAMCVGSTKPTCGSVWVAGNDTRILKGISASRSQIGFCPQNDPLLEGMTGRETLVMYAILRGIPRELIDSKVSRLLELLSLTAYADKRTEVYSGGNRRKLSLGIALVGDPDVLLIDESCSGVDPASMRKIWDLIARIARDRSVLLTTHSMDEAQAVASRAAIMSKGKLLCLGSVQHLKVNVFCDIAPCVKCTLLILFVCRHLLLSFLPGKISR